MKPRDYSLIGCALMVCGCVADEAGTDAKPAPDEETGLAMTAVVAADVDVDVAYLQYRITRVACTAGEEFEPLNREVRAELQQRNLPALENAPFDTGSAHRFADHFEVVPAGCYDITATPLGADTMMSAECGAARQNNIQVQDGLTTEVILLSQCTGPQTGALDAAVAFNQPPQILNLTYSPSKFIATGEAATVCASAIDPNGDPIEFEWAQVRGAMTTEPTSAPAPEQAPIEETAYSTQECVSIAPDQAGSYDFEVRVYDLIRDESGNQIRVEARLAQIGSPNGSRDSLRFPLHVSLADEQTTEPQEPQLPEEPELPEPGGEQGRQVLGTR